ncbi:Ankyrin repeat domain and putative OTU-like cysteine protease [Wolbachia endosymbiont of Drosophila simulans wNo]|uniref:ankyrin repeat domain-containing protein n=1 Tax=Wolbachia endosymbiont of Drosophila simulans TaxID=77038 RepID=UPI0002D2529E|nr:ankyrin repeat domain-containing protein [Wolbachia endosymbiont of Drosophila simulans]AGJ99493.1 Ankyrin repeat domain and putative OTU-like cysteine protease [Wolbachia endosymbiont of Drosophila simulans wNo]
MFNGASCSVNHSEKNSSFSKQISGQSKSIKSQREGTSIQSDLKLPKDFTIGKSIDGKDCFFDSVVQGLRQIKPDVNCTVKSLREVCGKHAFNNKEKMKDKIIEDTKNSSNTTIALPLPEINNDVLWETYLVGMQYTVKDIEKMKDERPHLYKELTDLKYGSRLRAPICGRPEIEGKMICNEYKIRLHLIEVTTTIDGKNVPIHNILDSEDYQKNVLSSEILSKKIYNEKDTIHILSIGSFHFEPILKNTVEELHKRFTSVIEDCSLSENEKVVKLQDFFKVCTRLDINFQINEHNDTPLHIAAYKGESKTVKFLLRVGAHVDISNNEGKTPIDIAEENNRKDIAKIMHPLVSYKEVDVPGDGNCLFWSVALAYLTPVKFDDYAFYKRFKKLFEEGYDVQAMQKLIQDNINVYGNNTLRKLVTKVFRIEVIHAMYSNREVLETKINMTDFFESWNESYFITGIFKEKFKSKFNDKKIKQYNIDVNKLQPDFFNEDEVKRIRTELDKMQECSQLQQFMFEAYLECMEVPGAWGGEYEIYTISKLLETMIIVSQKGSEDRIYNEQRKYYNKIHLSYKEEQHYQFYQIEHSNLISFVISFVQLFEIKLAAYDAFGNMLRQEKKNVSTRN